MTDRHAEASPSAAVSTPPKLDPESLALRARPMRAIRFKRGVVVGIAALGSVGLISTAWLALKPGSFTLVSPAEDRNVLSRPSTDTLAGLPTSYGDAPRLGPPLPGDLGRPILEHQRAMATEVAGVSAPVGPGQEAITERDRLAAERTAARQSGVLVKSGGAAANPAEAVVPATVATSPERASSSPVADQAGDTSVQQRKVDIVGVNDTGGAVNPQRLQPAVSPYTLSAGSVISASLVTGLRSDVPGLVIAQVTERVFDTATGRIELVPQGARLVGTYDSVVAFGQRRALVVWQRIIMPNGSSISVDNVPATDEAGYAGLADKVDQHTWTLLKGVAISTLLGVGSSYTFAGESDLVQAIRQSTQQNVSRAGDQVTSRNLQVQPTITVRPGARVRLVVHRDLVLTPARS